MALAPSATGITVYEVLEQLDAQFAPMARAVERGEFALWVGSGISRRAPNLGELIERAIEFIRVRAVDVATAARYMPVLEEAIELADLSSATLTVQFQQPFATWPERTAIVEKLWNKYSRVLDLRITGEADDFVLWNAIDIREAFHNPQPPAAEHLCIAILILEGAVRHVASANWDGFLEAAVARLSNNIAGVLQVVVDPNQLRSAPGRARLLKFHGCIVYATNEEGVFRKYLTGSQTQITQWPDAPLFAAMRNEVIGLATNHKTLVLGLSIQDNNLQSIFSRAKQVNPWPWPCEPAAPGHVFCEDQIKQGQRDVLRVVYSDAYTDNADAIHAATHLRAWGEQVLVALVLKLVTEKLVRLLTLALAASGRAPMTAALSRRLLTLRDETAKLAVGDRTDFVNVAIATWSRLIAIFRTGSLPTNIDAYEIVSGVGPELLAADPNAQASGLGRLGIALALLQHGRAVGQWELSLPTDLSITAGALTARGTRVGASGRPLFLVKSATEAIALEVAGAFANDNAVVVHGDDVWKRLTSVGSSARRVRAAPGRTGHVGTTHVSLGDLMVRCTTEDELTQGFLAEMML